MLVITPTAATIDWRVRLNQLSQRLSPRDFSDRAKRPIQVGY